MALVLQYLKAPWPCIHNQIKTKQNLSPTICVVKILFYYRQKFLGFEPTRWYKIVFFTVKTIFLRAFRILWECFFCFFPAYPISLRPCEVISTSHEFWVKCDAIWKCECEKKTSPPPVGIEPTTTRLRVLRSTIWAMEAVGKNFEIW